MPETKTEPRKLESWEREELTPAQKHRPWFEKHAFATGTAPSLVHIVLEETAIPTAISPYVTRYERGMPSFRHDNTNPTITGICADVSDDYVHVLTQGSRTEARKLYLINYRAILGEPYVVKP